MQCFFRYFDDEKWTVAHRVALVDAEVVAEDVIKKNRNNQTDR